MVVNLLIFKPLTFLSPGQPEKMACFHTTVECSQKRNISHSRNEVLSIYTVASVQSISWEAARGNFQLRYLTGFDASPEVNF